MIQPQPGDYKHGVSHSLNLNVNRAWKFLDDWDYMYTLKVPMYISTRFHSIVKPVPRFSHRTQQPFFPDFVSVHVSTTL